VAQLQSRPSRGRRVLCMSLAWLFLGAIVGVFNGLENDRGSEIAAMMLGGMIVLPVPGLLLGLIGGDAIGSLGGAAAGLFGCWLADYGGPATIQPQGFGVVVVIGALAGATGFLFLRFLIWKYTMIFGAIAWFLRAAPLPARARVLAGHHLLTRGTGLSLVRSKGQARHFGSPDRRTRHANARADALG
jgi:hypothetical protein